MRAIYKYHLSICKKQTITIYDEARILSVQNQNGALVLWALVETDRPAKAFTFVIVGTGHNLDELSVGNTFLSRYLASVQIDQFVWHVFMSKYE